AHLRGPQGRLGGTSCLGGETRPDRRAPAGEIGRCRGRSDRNRRGTGARRPHCCGGGHLLARGDEGERPRRRSRGRAMNPGVFSVNNNRIVFTAMLLAVIGGFYAYMHLGRLEDPEFTIKQALIITPYPGASAEEVAQEVSNPIEIACQQLGQLD